LSMSKSHNDSKNVSYLFSCQFLSERILKAARVVYITLLERNPGLIRDRKHHLKTYR